MSDDLKFDFQRAASAYDVPGGDVSAVLQTARRRTVRRHRAVAGLSAVAVLAASFAVVRLSDRGDDGIEVRIADNATRGDAGVVWQRVDTRTSIGEGRLAGEGPLYALSTAAGERDMAKARRHGTVWTSEDGIEWTAAGRLSGDLYLSDLSKTERRLYAIGTTPSTAALTTGRKVNDIVIGWSDDNAATWRTSALPLDMASIATKARQVSIIEPDIAAGPKGTVAVVRVHAELDVPRLLVPKGATAPNGWAVTDSGIDLLGRARVPACPAGTSDTPPGERSAKRSVPQGGQPQRMWSTYCFRPDGTQVVVPPQEVHGVTGTFSFADLGVGGDALAAVRGEPIVFVAGPGSTDFERAELPDVGGMSMSRIEADDDGFDLAIATSDHEKNPDRTRLALLRSDDGKSWRNVISADRTNTWALAMGRLDGNNVIFASGQDGGLVLSDNGNGGWSPLAVAGLVEPHALGGGIAHAVAGDVGPFGAALVVAIEPPRSDDKRERSDPPKYRVLVTRDGDTWQDHAIDDLAGATVSGVTRVVVTDDSAVVTVALAREGNSGPQRQATFVGTGK